MRLYHALFYILFLSLLIMGFVGTIGANSDLVEIDGVAVVSDDNGGGFRSIDKVIERKIHDSRVNNDNHDVSCITRDSKYTGRPCVLDSGIYYFEDEVVEINGTIDADPRNGVIDIVVDGNLEISEEARIGSLSRQNRTNVYVHGGVSVDGCSVVNGMGGYTQNRSDFIFFKSSRDNFILEIGSSHNYTMYAPDAHGEIREGDYGSFFDVSIDESRTTNQAIIGDELVTHIDIVNRHACEDVQEIELELRQNNSDTPYLSLNSTVNLDGNQESTIEFKNSTDDLEESKYMLNASSDDDYDELEIELYRPITTRIAKPPIYKVTKVSGFSESLAVGEETVFSTLVKNIGGSGTRNLVLDIEEFGEKRQLLGLAHGEEEWIKWEMEFEESGSYQLSIGDQDLGVIEVEEPIREMEKSENDENLDGEDDLTGEDKEEDESTPTITDKKVKEDEGSSFLDLVIDFLF